jgi:hypothetical protein
VVILYKIGVDAGLAELVLLIALHEEAAFIFKDLGLDHDHVWDGSGDEFHRLIRSVEIFIRAPL